MAACFGFIVLAICITICVGQGLHHHKYRHQSPFVSTYFAYYCKNTDCVFHHVCEKRKICHYFPFCFKVPKCVVNLSQRPGSCPSPWDIPNHGSPQCLTDNGCQKSGEICCHGFYSSQCRKAFLITIG